jgi:hypothetical protein
MQCEHVKERWPDYAAGSMGPAERAAVDRHLAGCATCRTEAEELDRVWELLGALPEETPSAAVRERVDALIDVWREGAGEGARSGGGARARDAETARAWWRSLAWPPAWQVAFAALCLFVGFSGGRLWTAAPRTDGELAELRGEVHTMKQIVALSLMQQQSAAERLRGVTWSYGIERPDSEVLDALLDTLRHDGNVNVRLAAVDALQQFAVGGQGPLVRAGLIDAIPKQDSPLVQIALVDALVELREPRSVEAIRTLAGNQQANEAVRKRAAWALTKLGQRS